MASLTRAQQRQKVAEIRHENTRLEIFSNSAAELEHRLAAAARDAVWLCDGYTQALTDLEAAEQRERALREVVEQACVLLVHCGLRSVVLNARSILRRALDALPTPSAPEGQDG